MNKFNSVDIDDLEDVKLGEIFLNMKIIFKSFLFLYKSFFFFLDFIIWKSKYRIITESKKGVQKLFFDMLHFYYAGSFKV